MVQQLPRDGKKIKKGESVFLAADFHRNEVHIFRAVKNSRQHVVKIEAPTFEIAKEKAISKFNHVKHFKQKPMDLVTAIERAKAASKKLKRPHYVIDDGDGECSVGAAPLRGTMNKYVNGELDKTYKLQTSLETFVEIGKPKDKKRSLPAQSEKAQKLISAQTAKETAVKESTKPNKNKMETKSKLAKKSGKKVAAKKTAKKKSGSATRALDAPIQGGAAKVIFDAISKKAHTKEQLAKLADTKEGNIGWYLNKIRNNGYDVQNTEKGYIIKKGK